MANGRGLMAFGLFGSLLLLGSAGWPRGRGHDDSPQQVAELLDRIVQPRFQNTEGVFGISRVDSVGHANLNMRSASTNVGTLKAKSSNEASLLHTANSFQRDYLVAFLHTAHAPGSKSDKPVGRVRLSPLAVYDDRRLVVPRFLDLRSSRIQDTATSDEERQAERDLREAKAIEKAAVSVLPRLRRGEKVDLTGDPWFIALRPVRASQDACLSCHVGAKPGDTLGVMVYAVRNAAGRPIAKNDRG